MQKSEQGFTLIELLISVVIALIITAAIFGIYANSAGTSAAMLKSSKLNQELYSLMLVMSNDIRRAGYWKIPDNHPEYYDTPQSNPFSKFGFTELKVIDDSCILYTFDSQDDDEEAEVDLDKADVFGFRLSGDTVEMRSIDPSSTIDLTKSVNSDCSQKEEWEPVTDDKLIRITELTFSLANSQCINANEPNGQDDDADGNIDNVEELNCYDNPPADSSGEITVETRQVTIALEGELVNDPGVRARIVQDVRVRNDMVRVR